MAISYPLLAEEASLYFNPKKVFPRGEEGFPWLLDAQFRTRSFLV